MFRTRRSDTATINWDPRGETSVSSTAFDKEQEPVSTLKVKTG